MISSVRPAQTMGADRERQTPIIDVRASGGQIETFVDPVKAHERPRPAVDEPQTVSR